MKRISHRIISGLLALIMTVCLCGSSFTVSEASGYHLEPELRSDYAYVVDLNHGLILLDERSEDKMYPASLTKMMTVILAIELFEDYDQIIEITDEMLAGLKEADASIVGYKSGDKASVMDLLYGCIMPSGADACNALAITLSGSIDEFVKLMNNKAVALGMAHTHFTNPTGLHDDDLYSTCRDIATLLEYCIQNELFAKVASTVYYTTAPTPKYPDGIDLYASAIYGFIRRGIPHPGLIGGKTGFTDEALQTIACWAELNDMKLIIVTAHGYGVGHIPGHFSDVSQILTTLEQCHYQTVCDEGEILQTITFKSMFGEETMDITSNEMKYIIPDDASIEVVSTFEDVYETGLKEKKVSGRVLVTVDHQIVYEKNLTVTVPKEKNIFAIVVKFFQNLF